VSQISPKGRVSVVIPNYNREGLIGKTIANLLAQTLPPYEIIVVDDGSTDKSVEVIRSFGSQVILLQQQNEGPGAARNAGLRIANGDYIQFQDSDDLFALNKLQAQAEKLDESGADIALGPWAHVFIGEKQIQFESCVLQQALPSPNLKLYVWQLRSWATIFQSLLYRRDFLLATGWYRTDIRYPEDTEYFFRILCRLPRVVFAGETLTLYRVDAPNKLSHDSGRAKKQRDLDWAKCLNFMNQERKARKIEADTMTSLIFRSGIRKHMRYWSREPGEATELVQSLTDEVQKSSHTLLNLVELWLRIAERIRLARTGYRWMPGYQAAPATDQQLKLIQELGYEVCQTIK
jgi:glycosyltransferase involved in cell wall biosynthesis